MNQPFDFMANYVALESEVQFLRKKDKNAESKIYSLNWLIQHKDSEIARAKSDEKIALFQLVSVKQDLVKELRRSEQFLTQRNEAFEKLDSAILERDAALKEIERLKLLLAIKEIDDEVADVKSTRS